MLTTTGVSQDTMMRTFSKSLVSLGAGAASRRPLPERPAEMGRPWLTRTCSLLGILAMTWAGSHLRGSLESMGVEPSLWMPFMAIAFAFGLCTILLAELHQLGRRRLRTLHRQATQDPLTQCLNHGAVHTFGALAHARSRRRTEDLGVLMIDIDRFKGVNDRYGHMTGDALIVDLARRLQRAVRAEDAVGRCGGDEFLVVMPGVDRDGLQALAARIEDVLHPRVLVKGEPVGATVSVGAACLSGVGADSSWRDLVIAADAALYASKGAGRGRWSLPPVPQHPADALLGAAT